ncbi:hypothetical protein ACTXT7_013693 [Hymenolepis weldensis]
MSFHLLGDRSILMAKNRNWIIELKAFIIQCFKARDIQNFIKIMHLREFGKRIFGLPNGISTALEDILDDIPDSISGELKLPEIMNNQLVEDKDNCENYSTKHSLVFASSLLKDTEGWFGIPRQIMK